MAIEQEYIDLKATLAMDEAADHKGHDDHGEGKIDRAAVLKFVQDEFREYKNARCEREVTWERALGEYIGSPRAMEDAQQTAGVQVGDVGTNWRHKLSTGKCFEVIETINSYLQGAFFPNKDWFDLVPLQPTDAALTKTIKKYVQAKLQQFQFTTKWDSFVRQALICGTSVLAIPWRADSAKWYRRVPVRRPILTEGEATKEGETKWETVEEDRIMATGTDFQVLNLFDCYLDPSEPDSQKANFIRLLRKPCAEVCQLIEEGYYNVGSCDEITAYVSELNAHKDQLQTYQGIQGQDERSGDECELVEFWGDVQCGDILYKNMVVTLCGDCLLRCEVNPYWAGKPFVIATCIPSLDSPYGLGIAEVGLGLFQEMNIVTNQRLDNLELATDCMWMLLDDSIDVNEVYTRPGRVIKGSMQNALEPINKSTTFTINYQEAQVIEQRIDKVCGTGAFIGVGQGRNGDRVTAQEIEAQRDAGGNRQSGVHKHLEATALTTALNKVYRNIQQFVETDEVVRVAGNVTGMYLYIQVGLQELNNDFLVHPMGASHIIDQQQELDKRMQFVETVTKIPQFAELLDYEALLNDLAQKFGYEDVNRYIKPKAKPEAQPQAPQAPKPLTAPQPRLMTGALTGGLPLPPEEEAYLQEKAAGMGGTAGITALNKQLLKDGGKSALTAAVSPPGAVPG